MYIAINLLQKYNDYTSGGKSWSRSWNKLWNKLGKRSWASTESISNARRTSELVVKPATGARPMPRSRTGSISWSMSYSRTRYKEEPYAYSNQWTRKQILKRIKKRIK